MENIYQNPIVLKVHNGTPRGDIDLCRSCRNSHRMVSGKSGRETVLCNASYQNQVKITEPIAECSNHAEKNRPTLSDMNEIAWTLMTDKGGRKIGFQSPEQRRDGQPSGSPVGF